MSKRAKSTQGGSTRKSSRNSVKSGESKKGGDFKFDMKWVELGDALAKGVKPVVCLDGPDCKPSSKIAAFDIDYTIVKPKSGKKFSQNKDDWIFLYDEVPKKLKSLSDDGYKLVFITNQGGIEKGRTDLNELQYKFCRITEEIGCPVQVYILTGYNHFRKPNTAVWELMHDQLNGGIKVDLDKSLYVGDAAGRDKDWSPGKPKDFSCDDRKFGTNVGVSFSTPEEFFLGEAKCTSFNWRTIDPSHLLANCEGKQAPDYSDIPSKSQELILMVGCPASGKSTFTKRYLVPAGYVQVNRDTLTTPARCQKETEKAMKEGKSVCVDNTNPKSADRGAYIAMAKQNKIPVRCLSFTTPSDISTHLNYFRQSQTQGEVRRIPVVAYRVYDKAFEAPSTEEGIDEIIEIEFHPKFDSDEDKTMFGLWTPEP